MNLQIIQKEIKSQALQEVVKSLIGTVDEMKARTIDYQSANVEIVGCKHIIQSIALDWAYNGKIKTLKTITKEK
jgi:hypothetical protein